MTTISAFVQYLGKNYLINLLEPIDISIPLDPTKPGPLAWYIDKFTIEPVRMGDFVGSVEEGASVNFRNIFFNPHAHGTHTESYGHISKEIYSVNQALKVFHFVSHLITIQPEKVDGDLVVTENQMRKALPKPAEAVVLRTTPNPESKKWLNYAHTNPPYIEASALKYLREKGVKHLLLDLPSVDKEVDGGALAAHRAFWNFPEKPEANSTITEFIYVPDAVKDGLYLLNLQIAPFENDASPSRPVLYRLIPN